MQTFNEFFNDAKSANRDAGVEITVSKTTITERFRLRCAYAAESLALRCEGGDEREESFHHLFPAGYDTQMEQALLEEALLRLKSWFSVTVMMDSGEVSFGLRRDLDLDTGLGAALLSDVIARMMCVAWFRQRAATPLSAVATAREETDLESMRTALNSFFRGKNASSRRVPPI